MRQGNTLRGEGSDPERVTPSSGVSPLKRIERLRLGWSCSEISPGARSMSKRLASFSSSGSSLNYLMAWGLVDREDLRTHIERSFYVLDVGEPGGPFRGASTCTAA